MAKTAKKTTKKKTTKKKKSQNKNSKNGRIGFLDSKDIEKLKKIQAEMQARTDVARTKIEIERLPGMTYPRDARHLRHLIDLQAFIRSLAREHCSRFTKSRVEQAMNLIQEVLELKEK